jgi:hypothetical protein
MSNFNLINDVYFENVVNHFETCLKNGEEHCYYGVPDDPVLQRKIMTRIQQKFAKNNHWKPLIIRHSCWDVGCQQPMVECQAYVEYDCRFGKKC